MRLLLREQQLTAAESVKESGYRFTTMAPTDEGGGGEPPGQRSWADILGSSLPPSWNKNILELVLEKD